jgi:ParB family transcriptional regulator, chromosome partitioning protein
MSQTTLPFSALSAPKGNPRKKINQAAIVGLAQSIKADGVVQNLVVIPEADGRYRVHIGKRRYRALKLLLQQGDIEDDFPVPVDIRDELDSDDALRLATVENVQREALDPIDEAEAFATLAHRGSSIGDVAARTGVSEQTVRRRLALAALSKDAKAMVRSGELSLAVAEALTLGNESQQRQFIDAVRDGAHLTADNVRSALLRDRPSKALAIFDPELYSGTYTTDLFGTEDETFFDDVEEFNRLQREAVDEIAKKHSKRSEFVDIHNSYAAPWWQYRKATKGESSGTVINLSPNGSVEVRRGLQRTAAHNSDNGDATQAKPERIVRAEHGPTLLRYTASEKTAAVLGALLANPRKMAEVAAVLLLSAHRIGNPVRIELHASLRSVGERSVKSKGLQSLLSGIGELAAKVGLVSSDEGDGSASIESIAGFNDQLAIYQALQQLPDHDLARILSFVPLLAFGQERLEAIEPETSLFSAIARDLDVSMREWWMPSEEYLAMLRREQLEAVAVESGAAVGMSRFISYKKKGLVEALARHFAKTSDPAGIRDELAEKGRSWLPRLMHFGDNAPEIEDPTNSQ